MSTYYQWFILGDNYWNYQEGFWKKNRLFMIVAENIFQFMPSMWDSYFGQIFFSEI